MQNETVGKGLFEIVKCVGLALGLSLLGAVVLASVFSVTAIPDKATYPLTQTVKVLSVFFGATAFIRGERGWLKGVAVGLIFSALSYLAFSAFGGDFSLSYLLFGELALTALAGAVGGIVAVNVSKTN